MMGGDSWVKSKEGIGSKFGFNAKFKIGKKINNSFNYLKIKKNFY